MSLIIFKTIYVQQRQIQLFYVKADIPSPGAGGEAKTGIFGGQMHICKSTLTVLYKNSNNWM